MLVKRVIQGSGLIKNLPIGILNSFQDNLVRFTKNNEQIGPIVL